MAFLCKLSWKNNTKNIKQPIVAREYCFNVYLFLALQYGENIRNNKKQNRQGVLLKKERDWTNQKNMVCMNNKEKINFVSINPIGKLLS